MFDARHGTHLILLSFFSRETLELKFVERWCLLGKCLIYDLIDVFRMNLIISSIYLFLHLILSSFSVKEEFLTLSQVISQE